VITSSRRRHAAWSTDSASPQQLAAGGAGGHRRRVEDVAVVEPPVERSIEPPVANGTDERDGVHARPRARGVLAGDDERGRLAVEQELRALPGRAVVQPRRREEHAAAAPRGRVRRVVA